ncbi:MULTISPECIES: hypothetical protein [Rhodomicrobium]|uniref:hypothetical protein n=1 Tax=Rhodomicrobium TaxID=1068 RepID=UPI000B4A93D0|nr:MULTISPECIES: hypothetical protein [Rhodomicrobium]
MGARVSVDVLAMEGSSGWELVRYPRKLFPKNGQVELLSASANSFRSGEWLVFQIMASPRPNAQPSRISAHRILSRFADLQTLGTVEAARFLFTREGWDGAINPGHWTVRFSEDCILTLQLARSPDGRLRCVDRSLSEVDCYTFEAGNLLGEPAAENPQQLYDLHSERPLVTYNWSPGADYVAHVVRALAGADDPRLPELITWLELHRDEVSGRISAIGTDHKLAFEALRSGELAARLTADREVMSAYLDAVRIDPAIAAAVEQAVRAEAVRSREVVRTEIAAELAAEQSARRAEQDAKSLAREATLELELQAQITDRERELSEALERRIAERDRTAIAASKAEWEAAVAEVEAFRASVSDMKRERDALAEEVEALKSEAERQRELVRVAEGRLTELERDLASTVQRSVTRAVATLPVIMSSSARPIDRAELGEQIARCVLLTGVGKQLMMRFAAYLLSGEVPILDGPQVEDFSLIAEALLAAGRLVSFDADATIIAPEDIWSRPGSRLDTQVAQAAVLASTGYTCLVKLHEIDRSAARCWYPAICALARRGLLPRRLLMFATLSDPASEEAAALPANACRLTVDSAVAEGAALVAPGLLGSGTNATALHLDPGDRPTDLSSAMATLPALADLGIGLDIATSLRLARAVVETEGLAPPNSGRALETARNFCRDTRRDEVGGTAG